MSYTPPNLEHDPISIGIMSLNYLETRISWSGTTGAAVAWPSANLCLYVPVSITKKVSVTGLWWVNGSSVAGNVCMGLYDEAGDLIVDTGIVAQSGVSAVQMPSITEFLLTRGRYWMGLVFSSASATLRAWNVPTCGTDSAKWIPIAEEALGSTQVPATMNPSASARSIIPQLGLMRS